MGDAVIGVNPVTDDVENLSRVLDTIYGVIDKFNIPTQGCVLAHVTTQIEAIRRGAPGGLIFQISAAAKRAERVWRGTGDARRSARSGRRVQPYRRGKLPLLRNRTRLGAIRWR